MPITLPKAPTPKKNDLRDLTVLLHGQKKIGESSICASIPDAVFAATEPGLGHLEVHQVPITSWQDFIDFCNLLVKEQHGFKTVVIDTVPCGRVEASGNRDRATDLGLNTIRT